MARNSATSAPFQHCRQAANSAGVVTGSAAHWPSLPCVAASNWQSGGKPSVVRSTMVQDVEIFAVAAVLFFWILSCVAVSGQGPGSLPWFSLSRHFSVAVREIFLNDASVLITCF